MLGPRRKIHDVYISTYTAAAEEALKRIGELYAIEEAIRGLPAIERLAARQSRSKPLLISLHDWLVEKSTTLSKKSRRGEAFAYALNQWDALCYYVMMVWQSLITTLPNEPFVPSVLGKRILSSSAATTAVSVEHYCMVLSEHAGSMVSIRKPTFAIS